MSLAADILLGKDVVHCKWKVDTGSFTDQVFDAYKV